ncbi:hypothetical protein T4E_3801 [Trichinella pseudospiralis]|uniref:Uncharacterized protein n=1 Tax=Trichinella pseudospiralis TaxID=6337 RepID=A0A0V0YMV8_TRIPS|nr:hypothetical protein T4E_3801 [Trichinella pseudospiralis]
MCQEMNCMRLYDRMSIRVAVSSSSGLSHFVARIFCSQTDDSGNKANHCRIPVNSKHTRMYGNGRRLTLSNNVGQAYIEADDFDARPCLPRHPTSGMSAV